MGGIWAIEATNRVNQVKRFYFGDTMVTLGNPPDPSVLDRQRNLRRAEGTDLEEEIKTKFALDFKKLAEGELDNWFDDTDGVLAIIIIF